jgi:hypothetical protein
MQHCQQNINYYQNQYANNQIVVASNEFDRQSNGSPASSVGLGSSIASSPSPSLSSPSDSRVASPNLPNPAPIVNSTPSNYSQYHPNAQYYRHQHEHQQQHSVPRNYPGYNQNYYNQQAYYENYGHQTSDNHYYHQKPQQSHSYTDDSNYYSRNNSISQASFNDSPNLIHHQNQLRQPLVQVQVKPKLKFSIDSILGINDSEEKKPEQLSADILASDYTDVNSRKRKLPKSAGQTATESKSSRANSNKRLRTIFTQEQLDRLEDEFLRQQYMVGSERSYLAKTMNLSESQVKIWFQNRRIKWRKTQFGGAAGDDKSIHENDISLNDSNCEE